MDQRWRLNRVKFRLVLLMVVLLSFDPNPGFCYSLNSEGLALLRFRERIERDPFGALLSWGDNRGDMDPCSWFGVGCSDGRVVTLNLRDLCLRGTLELEIGSLAYLKSIILRNNSFHGDIPKEIGELQDLELLDLRYNNFSGAFPSEFGTNLSLTTLLLDGNEFLGIMSPELYELKMLSELQIDDIEFMKAAHGASCGSSLVSWNNAKDIAYRRLLQVASPKSASKLDSKRIPQGSALPSPSLSSMSPSSLFAPAESPFSPLLAPSISPLLSPSLSLSPSPSPSPLESPLSAPLAPVPSIFLTPSPSPLPATTAALMPPVNPTNGPYAPQQPHEAPLPSPTSTPSLIAKNSNSKHQLVLILAGVLGGATLVLILVIGIICLRSNEVVTVKPWATGLSGQLQKAFVTGAPKLKRSELEAACEDFSNIIGSFAVGTVYKGTLSSGVEIAVTSSAVKSRAEWSKNLEAQFRKKIDALSKVNHKNFVNLIGYCEEDEPFTRMMVFEYAPNGTLFEHLHIQEAEHLDWTMRLRIAMGMAYCLEHMHQLTPPIVHGNLQSSSVYLTEDYAAKLSDFSFWNDKAVAKTGSASVELLESQSIDPASNVYSFGVILFEMITGRMPYSVQNDSADWACDYMRSKESLREMVDPTLKSFREDIVDRLLEVIKVCVHPDPRERPSMKDIAAKLKEITAMGPDGATPKLSPLWWAEIEIMSMEAC